MSQLSPSVKKHIAHISTRKLDGTSAGSQTQYFSTKKLAEEFVAERIQHYQSQGAVAIKYYFGELQEEYTTELKWVHSSPQEPVKKKKSTPKSQLEI